MFSTGKSVETSRFLVEKASNLGIEKTVPAVAFHAAFTSSLYGNIAILP
jgi:hypothetical protein